jgi:hypothetical protein
MIAFALFAQTQFSINNVKYTVKEGSTNQVKITGCTASGSVVIPEKVTYENNEYTVTMVGRNSFTYSSVTNLTLPNTVDTIGNYCFVSSDLETITIPTSLKYIDDYAFYDVENLESIDLPNGVEAIGKSAFGCCDALTHFTFGENLKYIGQGAFYKAKITSAILPNTCDSIATNAFLNCTALTSVSLSDNIHYLGAGAFSTCSSLTSINIPNKIDSLNEELFFGCKKLETIHIPANILKIKRSVFARSGIKSFTVAEDNPSFKVIEEGVYDKEGRILYAYPLKGKTNCVIPEGVVGIWGGAFYESDVSNVTLPSTMKAIDESAFAYSKLTTINFPESLIFLGPTVFYHTSFTHMELPPNITKIYDGLMGYCSELTSITIPSKVEYIDVHSFFNDKKINEVHCLATTPPELYEQYEAYDNPFFGVNLETCKLYVPEGTKEDYMATDWNMFKAENVFEVKNVGVSSTAIDNATIQILSNSLSITPNNYQTVAIYSTSGRCIYQNKIENEVIIPLEKGIYLVKINKQMAKICIK